MATVILLSLLGAACYGIGSVFQHQAAGSEPPELALRADLLLRLARHPRWLVGNGLDVAGLVFQLIALRRGSLILVEPLQVASLLFAFPIAALLGRRRVSFSECAAAAVVTSGLALFLAFARPSEATPHPSSHDLVVLTCVAIATVGVLTVIAIRSKGGRTALILAAGAGIAFGYMAALTSVAWAIIGHGVVHGLGSWQVYAAIISGVTGIFLTHSAFGSGHLRYSLPTMTVAQPLAAVVIGLGVFGEHIHTQGWAPVVEILGLGAVTIGVYFLALPEIPE